MTYPYHIYLQRLAKAFMIIERFHIMSPCNHKLEFMLLGLNVVNQHNVMMGQTFARAYRAQGAEFWGSPPKTKMYFLVLCMFYKLSTSH